MRDKNCWLAVVLSLLVVLLLPPRVRAETADEIRAKALAVLKSDAPFQEKAEACVDLARVGDKTCVPVLAGLLQNEPLAHRARYALEPIADPSVDLALRAALETVRGKLLVGVISSIGARRDAAAVELLTKHLTSTDDDLVRTTAIALGRIGTPAAGKALLDALKDAQGTRAERISDGLLACGACLAAQGKTDAWALFNGILAKNLPERFHAAAYRNIVIDSDTGMRRFCRMIHSDDNPSVFAMTLRVAVELKDNKDVTHLLLTAAEKLPADQAARIIKVLGQRGERSALPSLLAMTAKGEVATRVEAILAAAELGDAAAVPALVGLMRDPEDKIRRAAAASVAGLPGAEVDAAIVRMLETPDPPLRLAMLEIAGQRRIAVALPALRRAMSDADLAVRTVAVKSYGDLAGADAIPVLIDLLVKSTDAREIALCERVLGSVCPIAADKDACTGRLVAGLSAAGPTVKPAFLRTLRVVGGPDALKAVRGAVDDPDKEVHAAAVRVLGEWMSIDAAPVLLELAANARQPVDKILALRGYLGIAMQRNVAVKDRLAICRAAAPLIQREEEKRMLLGALGSTANAGALDLIVPCLDDPAVKREAVATVMAIAEKRPRKQHTALAKAALEKVVKVAADDTPTVRRAEEMLKQLANEK